jgi:ubiquinone/menaquinone biosynthesis C-methylase UbiE
VTAIDSSSHAATLCRHTCTDPDQATILVADCRTTPFRDESFDVIIASHITSHLLLAGRSQLAGEVFRLLRHRGRMYFRDFSTGDFRYGRGEETEPGTFMRNNGILTHYFKDDEVPALFSGLTITSIKYQRWEMRIRGTVFPRAEIVAELQKPD